MNVLFTFLFVISALLFLVLSPEKFMEAITAGSNNAITLSIKTLSIYGFWMGLMKIVEELGITKMLSKILRPITRLFIGKLDLETESYVATNISCNMLGLGNMATPLGIKGMQRMCDGKEFIPTSAIMFFAVNATSIQLVSTTVITLRTLGGSKTPYDILLPSLIVGIFTTALSVVFVKIFCKEK